MGDPYNPPRSSDRGCFSFSCGCCSGGCLTAVVLISLGVFVFAYGYWIGMVEHPGEYGYVHVLGNGMSPTLTQGDWVLVDLNRYARESVSRGDIVLFARPGEAEGDSREFLRVAGLAGESVTFSASGELMINGSVFTRHPYLSERDYRIKGKPLEPVQLGADQYYLLGDNRPDADDSRKFGPVALTSFRGKAVAVLFPPDRLGKLDNGG